MQNPDIMAGKFKTNSVLTLDLKGKDGAGAACISTHT